MTKHRHLEISYGSPAAFFELWLDPYTTYSCANWDPGVCTLEQAQIHKLDTALDALDLPSRGSFLDIGCGWGSLLKRGAERGYRGLGLTPVESQASFARDKGLSVDCCSWQEWGAPETFDGLASIGAFEHFGEVGPETKVRLKTYSNFFARCRQWLKPGGRFYLQTICQLRADLVSLPENVTTQMPILREFRGSAMPTELGEITSSATPWFDLVQLRSRRLDYQRTCEAWLENLQSAEESVVKVLGRRKFNHYQAYLKACSVAFASRWFTLYQMIFS